MQTGYPNTVLTVIYKQDILTQYKNVLSYIQTGSPNTVLTVIFKQAVLTQHLRLYANRIS